MSARLVVQISQHGSAWRDLYKGEFVWCGGERVWLDGLPASQARDLVRKLNARPKWLTGASYRTREVAGGVGAD